jgi:hypothetical protein
VIDDAEVLRSSKPSPVLAVHFHAVRFYDSEVSLGRVVAAFLREGVALRQPGLIIATPEHAQGIVAELRARELDVNAAQAADELIVLDAVERMAEFLVEGVPDPDRFQAVTKSALARACRGRANCTVRVYTEVADLLWRQGRDVAAMQFETLWNQLARTSDVSLLCGYATASFYKDASIRDVCRQHTHLVSADGTPHPSNADSLLIGALRS